MNNREEHYRLKALRKWLDFKESIGYDTIIKRQPNYANGESYCTGCKISIPRRLRCPKCGMSMRIGPKYNKGVVHRY